MRMITQNVFWSSDIDHPQIDKLIFVTAADCKLINVLLGMSGHVGKYSCMYCKASKARQGRPYMDPWQGRGTGDPAQIRKDARI